ncbi:dihydropteroate synthase [Synechococcus sp. PCC 6312]|uniref:dihydropteroate synthase n=1 Tax=Synechococcus sp. (strain ATCC 27167 / PCC 6312) TaxID=195253 RepID=UPI0012EA3793|nr:dihydropteroate synthase [Synechococcus sp. PCC 6312]
MGILNITPDSFSDGGEFVSLEAALKQAQGLADAGVDILDVGGQSTRPGAVEISLDQELGRVIPVIQAIRQGLDIAISIDTTRSEVAQAALNAGADLINDVSGGKDDPKIFQVAAQTEAPIILMHRRGTPQTMQTLTDYRDLIGELQEFFQTQISTALSFGISKSRIVIDPGIGFAKTTTQNIQLLQNLRHFQTLGCPILVGTSRKRFIGEILNQPEPKGRVWGTAATCCYAIAQGVDLVRVHDGLEIVQTCRMADALWRKP